MVHALQETRRVLKCGGRLIDLRPAAKHRAIELEIDGTTLHIGEMDSSRAFPDYAAANAAIQRMTKHGLLAQEHDATFTVATDMDTIQDLHAFAQSLRRSIMPPSLPRRIQSLIPPNPQDTIIRARRTMIIRRYQRL